jgi:hypothetical protein
MTGPTEEARPLSAWMAVLDRIEEAMRESLAQAPEPLSAPPEREESERHGGRSLQALDERLARWGGRLEEMERSAAEADALLAGEAQALEAWSQALAALRARLAGEPGA